MCTKCGKPYNEIEVSIYAEEGKEILRLCPNCLAIELHCGNFPEAEGAYTSEISGRSGAVKVVSGGGEKGTYFLTCNEAERLLGHSLTPEEFFALDRNHHGDYEIHDDFYDKETGVAICPIG